MARSPARPCANATCPNLQPCADHPRRQLSPSARGYGVEHQSWRAAVLARDMTCQWPGCDEPATEADHIVSFNQGGAKYDVDNGAGYCRSHHATKTNQRDGGFGNAIPDRHISPGNQGRETYG